MEIEINIRGSLWTGKDLRKALVLFSNQHKDIAYSGLNRLMFQRFTVLGPLVKVASVEGKSIREGEASAALECLSSNQRLDIGNNP